MQCRVLPSIRTLPLSGEDPELFSRAVRLAQQPANADLARLLLEDRYGEAPARRQLLPKMDEAWKDETRRLIEAPTKGELDWWAGTPTGGWYTQTASSFPERFAQHREAAKHPGYRAAIRARRKRLKILKDKKRHWRPMVTDRLLLAVKDLVAKEYPDPPGHVEHSRLVAAVAALLMPEPLPMLGELGAWPFTSRVVDDGEVSADPYEGYYATVLDVKEIHGREEVMFVRMPGERREVGQWFPLDELRALLRVAVDELEALPVAATTIEPFAKKDNVPPAKQDVAGQSKPAKRRAMTRREAARKLGINEGTVSRWLDKEDLKGRKVKKKWEIDPDSVELAVERAAAEKRAAAGETLWKCTHCGETTYSAERPTVACPCGSGAWYRRLTR